MDPARIAELLQPFVNAANHQRLAANDALYNSISTYIDILLRWNARINLTAIRNPDEIVARHFGESLFAARHLFPAGAHVGTAAPGCPAERSSAARVQSATGVETGASPVPAEPNSAPPMPPNLQVLDAGTDHGPYRHSIHPETATEEEEALDPCGAGNDPRRATNDRPRLADVGSGAGFPGIPLKLWNANINLTLIESNHKKATFLREVVRALTLTDIDICDGRAEDLPRAQARFDVVTLRAVELFEDAVRISATLLVPGGRIVLLIGSSQQDAANKALPSFTWDEPQLIPLSRSRLLLIGTSPNA